MKRFKLYIPIYGENIHFIISKDRVRVKEYVNDNKPKHYEHKHDEVIDDSFNSGVEGCCFVTFPTECLHIIVLQKKPTSTWELSGLIHELLHITFQILNRRGMPLTQDSQEAYTYLQQWMFNEFCTAFKIKLK